MTRIVGQDKVRSAMMKPLLETKDLLLPEYAEEQRQKLYELTLKKRQDVDSIPVHVSLFGELNKTKNNFNKKLNQL